MQTQETSDILSQSTLSTSRRPSLKFIFAPLSQPQASSTSSTNKIILDYLLYLSIQSRLKQAHVELLELSMPLPDDDDDSMEARKQRWVDSASKAEQDKNAVESIVAGILSSHQSKKPSFQMGVSFEQRLHLCQLTNLVFGRFDATSTGEHVIAHNSARRRRHETQMASIIETDQNEDCDIKRRYKLFSQHIVPSFCRRHRRQDCCGCRSPYSSKCKSDHAQQQTSQEKIVPDDHTPTPPAGLIEAIPAFMKTSADMLRHTLETGEDQEATPLIFAGQKVMGGGMPPRWYDLFLELLTQAAIESYLCDSQAGLEPIFEIFSYGDVEDEDEPEETEEEEHDEVEDQEEDEWGVKAADHHLLFPKTRTMYLFKTQVREREKEFLIVQQGDDLKQHFEKLAQRYPLQEFEKSMGEFIQMILDTMDVPALDKYEKGDESPASASLESSPELNPSALPPVYKYPGDGSLLMPEIPDVEEEEKGVQDTPSDSGNVPHGIKRRASLSIDSEVKRAR
ncbi:hypothetical protein DFQ28_006891 [Apophysomyces sp. BC1034]|nr:hypothetical protein DFQ30_000030 [Apophysomyces sp. BC1015]KAG0193007.1 hypothetical protein DFQ28_006891 [Apophysomyces sp. BC1034]